MSKRQLTEFRLQEELTKEKMYLIFIKHLKV